MKVLLTGGSSFTGVWFAQALAESGHTVVATVGESPLVDPLRARRLQLLERVATIQVGPRFGDPHFLDLIATARPDVLAHHGADVTNYKSPDFDVLAAASNNTRSLSVVLDKLNEVKCKCLVLTGSVFEGGEGSGSAGLPDVSAYGLSKRITSEMFSFYCRRAGMSFGKFVISNPFGPYESARYTAYLIRSWLGGETPRCATPHYVRDNIHVGLLARAYATFVQRCAEPAETSRSFHLAPSGYVGRQGDFTARVAREMETRLGMPCRFEASPSTTFTEPAVRINLDSLDHEALGFDETQAWDELAAFYRDR